MANLSSFRHVVTLEIPGPPAVDDAGGYTEAWFPLDPPTWHCSIQAASATDLERITAGLVTATASVVLRGRYHAGLVAAGPSARVQFRGRTFEIASVHNVDERDLELEVMARELVGRVQTPTVRSEDRVRPTTH